MTLVIWDGKVLAADKRVLFTRPGTKTVVKKEDNAIKLHLFSPKVQFNGDVITAGATIGFAAIAERLLALVTGGNSSPMATLQCELDRGSILGSNSYAELLLIGQHHIHAIVSSDGKVRNGTWPRSQEMAVGVGCKTAMKWLAQGLNAVESISITALAYSELSINVDYIDFTHPYPSISTHEYLSKKDVMDKAIDTLRRKTE